MTELIEMKESEENEVGKVDYVGIDIADNGWIVRWDQKEKKEKGCMDHCYGKSHTKIFGNSDEDTETAFEFFKTLKIKELNNK